MLILSDANISCESIGLDHFDLAPRFLEMIVMILEEMIVMILETMVVMITLKRRRQHSGGQMVPESVLSILSA